MYLLAINPGSTSTKFAIYEGEKLIFEKTIRHSTSDIEGFNRIGDQFEFRRNHIINEITYRGLELENIKAIIGRGGLLEPIESGIYEVNERMRNDLLEAKRGEHASNLGGLIAHDIAKNIIGARAFIVDPVVVDEMNDIARVAGHPEFSRKSIFHALNQKAVAREYADSQNSKYEDLNLVIAHMGGGISVGAHNKGRVIDVNNALNGEGPFSPERSGTLPAGQLATLCFSGEYSLEEVLKMLTGKGGMVSYLGTNNFMEICHKAEAGDNKAKLIQEAASYQVAKEIGAYATVMKGDVDAIILTGGMAYQKKNTDYITDMVSFIAPVIVYPGEDELKSLAYNGYLAMSGKIVIKDY